MMKVLKFFGHLFGFEKITKSENNYLHESNLKSTGYMSFIVIGLEIWMLFRQSEKYIIPAVKEGAPLFKTIYDNVSLFILFIMVSLPLTILCLFTKRNEKLKKGNFIALLVSGLLCVLYGLTLPFEYFRTGTGVKPLVMNSLLVLLYVLSFLIGAIVVIYSIAKYFKNKNIVLFEHLTIIFFSLVCLTFGFRVSYSDFTGGKEIICFLTMVIYVGCLLIYRPYITILMLGTIFISFYYLLFTFNNGESFLSGDRVNYLTFVISLITICISMYHGRLSDARKAASIERMAKNDELTGLNNYNYFLNKTKAKIQEINEGLNDYIFLFVDLYNFNSYNDKHGFEAGNKFLCDTGKRIKELFEGSIVARQGDDRFVIFTNDIYFEEKLNILSEKTEKSVDDVLLSINCGGYRLQSQNDDPRKCIDRARYATRLIKRDLSRIYIEYDENLDSAYHKRLYVINNIETAIEQGWIRPYYQPVVWSDDGKLCGTEALCRWIDPTYGQIFPNEFIPVLEEFKLIHLLDAEIIKRVCSDLAESMKNGKPVVPVSINFSRLDFELMDPVKLLEDTVASCGIPRNLIHVEITESALVSSDNSLSNSMAKLRELGYSLWLDDFGSGYSSLNVLKDYTFDVLKIDMKFLTNLDTNNKARILIDCIIHMAESIGMLTLTEGVETKEEAEFLKKVGCGRLQGYLFGKPIPKEDLYKRIENNELILSDNVL